MTCHANPASDTQSEGAHFFRDASTMSSPPHLVRRSIGSSEPWEAPAATTPSKLLSQLYSVVAGASKVRAGGVHAPPDQRLSSKSRHCCTKSLCPRDHQRILRPLSSGFIFHLSSFIFHLSSFIFHLHSPSSISILHSPSSISIHHRPSTIPIPDPLNPGY